MLSPIVDISVRLGRRVRELREKSSLSLRALAQQSGVSSSMVSEVERGTKSPTIALLAGIAEGLGVPLSALLDAASPSPATATITRAAKQRTVRDPSGVERTSLGLQYADSTIEFVRFTLPGRAASGTFAAHRADTRERIHIERGIVDVDFGEQHVRLRRGDTLTYEATVRHSFTNASGKIAVLYLVIERR